MMLMIRPAKAHDIQTVSAIFRRAIADMRERFVFQWDDLYPSEEVLRQDIENGEMYLLCQGTQTVGAVAMGDKQDAAYKKGCWVCDEPAAVVHRLCVDPPYQHQGFGLQAMQQAELILKGEGFKSVRLDAFAQNPYALGLIENLGYRRVGEVKFRNGLFYLFEKSL